MKTFFRIALTIIFSCLILPMQVWAQEQESADTVDVVATGYGKDVDAAIKNACRAAVEQVVGSMVYAETLVSSGEVVSDKILGFSAGYVESHKQLGEPRTTEDGLVSVRVAAKVQRRKLGEELQKTGVNRVMFDGSSFHRKFEMIAENQDAALDLMDQLAKDLYTKAVSSSLVSSDYDINKNQAVFEIETQVDAQAFATFAKNFTDLIPTVHGNTVVPSQNILITRLARNQKEGMQPIITFSARSPLKTNANAYYLLVFNTWPRSLRIDQESRVSVDIHSIPREVFLQLPHFFAKRSLVIEALDANDEVLGIVKLPAPVLHHLSEIDYNGDLFGYRYNSNDPNDVLAVFPTLWVPDWTRESYALSPGLPVLKQMVRMNIPRHELNKMLTVRFRYE